MMYANPDLTKPAVIRGTLARIGVLIVVTMLVIACNSKSLDWYARQVARFAQQLPQPPDAHFLTSRNGTDSGSQVECESYYSERLYGTEQGFQEILNFYQQALTKEWKMDDQYRAKNILLFSRADGFVLVIDDHVGETRTLNNVIKYYQGQYATLYVVTITYGDPKVWEICHP
jgi:hypothetical protein